jgi:O-antigen ligase
MSGLTRRTGELFEKSEHALGRSWPLWVLALVVYSGAAFVVLTRIRLPTPLHLVVFIMAAVILVLTVLKLEWAIMGLALMIPFARPGFSLGAAKTFHVSGFNIAVFGVWVVYTLRYLLERGTLAEGPFVRRSPVDFIIGIFVFLVSAATLSGLSNMADPLGRAQILLYFKETIFYFGWLYLVYTLLRTPADLRRFAMLLASSGLLVAAIGLYNRMRGAAMSVGVSEAELEGGVVGGQTAGGWLGLVHPNFYGAFLIVSMPIWFFAVDHLKKVFHRLLAQAAVLLGFVGLLFTYSRSAWGGMLMGLGSQAIMHPPTLRRMALFVVLFAVVAQLLAVSMTGEGFVELIQIRFAQLQRSQFSSRPAIFATALEVVKAHPLLGVGGGAFSWYSAGAWEGGWLLHAHNVLLTYACEFGIPAALTYAVLLFTVIVLAGRNTRRLVRVPGYGFLAQGTFAGVLALTVQFQFEHILMSRDVGYALYGAVAVILGLNRFYNEGALPPPPPGTPGAQPSGLWKGS